MTATSDVPWLRVMVPMDAIVHADAIPIVNFSELFSAICTYDKKEVVYDLYTYLYW
jgi:hypothetical protein